MKIMVIDGNSILNRAFYGVRLLTNHEGLYTNAIYGFLSTLFKLQDEEMPDRTIVCFDVREKTFRHEKFESYKATRKGMPEELAVQLPVLKDVLDKLGIHRCELAGYEADDLIGTISRLADAHGDECVIVTGDKDSLQLVGGLVTVRLVVSRMGQSTTTRYDETVFREEYGFAPAQLIDLKALMGDSSDNITGVPGVGQKTAMNLLLRFGSLDAIYENIDSKDIKKGVREKLIAGEQSARDSYWLATIEQDVPMPIDSTALPEEFIDEEELYALLVKLEFKNFIKRLGLSPDQDPALSAHASDHPLSIITVSDAQEGLDHMHRLAKDHKTVSLYLTADQHAFCLFQDHAAMVCIEEDFAQDEWIALLRRLFSGALKLVVHDAKEHLVHLIARGIAPEGVVFDTCLCAYLLNPAEGAFPLQRVALYYLGTELPEASFEKEGAFAPLGTREDAVQQLVQWTMAVDRLYRAMDARLADLPKLRELYFDLELPLMTVLADMQHVGCKADSELLRQFGEMLDGRITALTARIYENAGGEFNINSPKQLGEVLFERLGLPVQKKTKSGYSTSADILESIAGYHPVVGEVLEYRQLTKLKSTYVDGLLKAIAPDGRIHSHFQQTVTATGRLSSVDPNLQNIPVRTDLGRELRRMFVAEEGHVLIDADYSQIELRVLAHIAQDEAMLEAFHAGQDIHAATASKVYGVPLTEVTAQMRSSCKAVNFGIVYGISEFSLAGDIGVTRKQAGEFIRSYLETYPGVAGYMEQIKAVAKEQGFVETLFGRRRDLPELSSKNYALRSFGERAAMNTPIQGTAADIIKIAMLRVWRRLREEGYKSRLILQVHDELILEAPLGEQEQVTKLLIDEMEGALKMDAPLVAEAHAGRDWYTAKG